MRCEPAWSVANVQNRAAAAAEAAEGGVDLVT